MITISFLFIFWDKLSNVLFMIGIGLYILQFMSYSYTSLINPGLPNKEQQIAKLPKKMNDEYRFCDQCLIKSKTEENVFHCLECNVCILGIILIFYY